MSSSFPDDADSPSAARSAIGETVRARLTRNPMVARIATDRAEMFLRHGFLSAVECDRLIALTDGKCHRSSLFSGTANAEYRTSSSCTLDIAEPVVAAVTQRISALIGLPADHGETLQAQRYHAGEEYKLHCDHFPGHAHYWPAMRDSGGQRCWTTMAYLNDVADGGETCFPVLDLMVAPKRGTLLIWNNMLPDGSPNGNTTHAASPVRSGSKYVVTKWFRERPWVALDSTP